MVAVCNDPAKGSLGWTNGGEFSLDARPHLCPLPRGEDFTGHAFGLFDDRPANPVAGFATDAAHVSPSPWGEGRDEGGREPFEIRTPQGQRVAPARHTKLGDGGNQMQADGNSFPVFILGWTMGAIGV
jgi:hypothetical protein